MIANEISCGQFSLVMTEPPDIRYDRDSEFGRALSHSYHIFPRVITLVVHQDLFGCFVFPGFSA